MNQVIRPLPEIFSDYTGESYEKEVDTSNESQSLKKLTASQGTRVYITEKVEYPENGIYMKYKDVPYLRQGFIYPEAVDNINNLKRVTVMLLSIVKGKGIKGRIGTFLAHYCKLADWMFAFYEPNTGKIRRIYLKENRYRTSVRELILLINRFISNLGINVIEFEGATPWDFGRVIGTMIEYDNAYHWRMEDIFSETTKQQLVKDPRKELQRLLTIYKERERSNIEFKAEAIIKVLRYLLLIPSVKKAFRNAVESIEVENLKMLKDESYFTMNYEGYEFQGKTLEERQKIWLEMTDGKIPERVFIPIQ